MMLRYIFVYLACLQCCRVNSDVIEFPTERLYGYNRTVDRVLYYDIITKHLCNNKTNDIKKCCSCQQSCIKYKMCCIDYFWYDQPFGNLGEYFSYYLNKTKKAKSIACLPIIPKLNSLQQIHVYMVDKCPKNKIENLKTYGNIPFYGSDGFIYKNLNIAECHGVKHLKPLSIVANCRNDPMLQNISANNCFYDLQDGIYDRLTKCYTDEIFTEVTTSTKTDFNQKLCNSYYGTIEKQTAIRNIHCLKTRNLTLENLQCTPINKPSSFMYATYSMTVSYQKNIEVIYSKKTEITQTIKCGRNEIFDFLLMKCTLFNCAYGYQSKGLTCVPNINLLKNVSAIKDLDGLELRIKKCFLKKTEKMNRTLILSIKHHGTLHDLQKTLHFNKVISDNSSIVYKHIIKNIHDLEFIQYKLSNIINKLATHHSNIVLSSERFHKTDIYGINTYKNFPNAEQCFKVKQIPISATKLDHFCKITTKTNEYFIPQKKYIITYRFTGRLFQPEIYTCSMYHLKPTCPLQTISKDNYTINSNFSIILNSFQHIYNVDQYLPLNKGIAICVTTSLQSSVSSIWLIKINRVEQYLTLVCMSLSFICYSMVIVTFLYYKDLRLVSALNIVALCMFLLISDITMLVTIIIDKPSLCKYLSMVQHWSFLSVLACSVIIAFEIWYTFLSVSPINKYSKSRFYKYLLAVVIPPTAIVLSCFYIDRYSILDIGYGRNNFCWLYTLKGRILFTIVPWCMVMVLNVVTLVYVLQKIYRQQAKSSQLLTKISKREKNSEFTKTALRLIVLLGIIEIVGFIQLPSNNNAYIIINIIFKYIFTILRGLRGVFIWLLYIYFNKRVWMHYLYFKKKKMEDSPTNTRASRISNKYQVVPVNTQIQLQTIRPLN